MMRLCSFAAVLALAIGVSATVVAAEPLEYFSRDADVVIRLKAPEATIAKAAELADAVQPGVGAIVRQNAPVLGQAILVPGLVGVDQSRDCYILLFTRGRSRPDAVFAIPAMNAEQLTAALPERMNSKIEADWVLYTDAENGVPEATEPGTGIASILTGESAAVFDRGDLSLFINVDHLKEVYGDDIEAGHQQIIVLMEQVAQLAPQANGMNMKGIMEMYGAMIDGTFQILDDASGCSVGITVGSEGVGVEKYVTFAEASVTSQRLAAHPNSSMPSLARLPSDAVAFFGFSGDMRRFMEWGWSMNASMLADDSEQKKKFEQAMDAWNGIDFGDMVGSFSLGSVDEGLMQYTAIAHAKPIAKVRQNMREMTDILGTIEAPGLKQQMTVQPDAETIGSRRIDLLTVTQEFDPNLDPTGMQQKMLQAMFGPGGITSRIAYLDDAYVMAMGGGRDKMEAVLKSFDASPNRDLDRRRTGLIEQPNLLVLVDVPTLALKGLAAATEIPNLPIPIDADALAQLPIEPSFLGFSLAGETNALRVRAFIPDEQFRGILALVGFFKQPR
ncbi:MAG: hypothetical protein AB7U20_19375 [Planctomycetaceae bacterium]